MKLIKLRAYQDSANYSFPIMTNYIETYKLPTFSNVIGMVHNACNFKNYHEINVSVQGKVSSKNIDYSTHWIYDAKDRGDIVVDGKKVNKIVPTQIYLNFGVNLTMHLQVKDEDLDFVYNSLKNPTKLLSLGRAEDTLYIKDVKKIEAEHTNISEDMIAKEGWYSYIGEEDLKSNLNEADYSSYKSGTFYNIPKVYVIKKIGKSKTRIFEKKKVLLDEYKLLEGESVLLDDDKEPVFLC